MSDTQTATVTTNAASTETSATATEVTGAEKLYGADSKPAETKVEETKAADSAADTSEAKTDTAAGETKTPDKYTFEVDEDSLLTDAHLDKIAAYAKERGLSQEEAQKLADMKAEALKSYKDTQAESFKEMAKSWVETAKNDKEIGGANFSKNVELAKRALKEFATPEFFQALDETGFGNHPELLRAWVRVGQRMSSDSLVLPGSQKTSSRSFEDIFYGSKE